MSDLKCKIEYCSKNRKDFLFGWHQYFCAQHFYEFSLIGNSMFPELGEIENFIKNYEIELPKLTDITVYMSLSQERLKKLIEIAKEKGHLTEKCNTLHDLTKKIINDYIDGVLEF